MREDDVPPQLVEGSVIFFAYAAIVLAAIVSITLNVYHDTRPATGDKLLPEQIAVMIGVAVPLLCAFISHVAATIPTGNWVKGWLFVLTGVLMYVSATAGTKTLKAVMGLEPALGVSVGVDATAMTFLGVLMLARSRKTALAVWQAGEAERQRRAAVASAAARYARPAARETLRGNSLVITPGNAAGNAPGAAGGNAVALTAGSTPPVPALPPGSSAGGEAGAGEDPGALASVSPMRRPAATDDEIRMLAEALADELAAEGKVLTVRAYTDKYGGKTARVAPIIADVKARLDGAAAASADGAR